MSVVIAVGRILSALLLANLSKVLYGIDKPFNPRMSIEAMFLHSDSVWYLSIARSGYADPVHFEFFPGYPMLVRAISPVVGYSTAALAISWFALIFAIWGTIEVAGDVAHPRTAVFAGFLLAWNPGSIFLLAGYPTSLMIALCAWACHFAIRRRYWLAAVLGAVASAVHPIGATAGVALALYYLATHPLKLRELLRAGALGVVSELGVLSFFLYAWVKTGNFFEQHWADSFWGITFRSPIWVFNLDWTEAWRGFKSGSPQYGYLWHAISVPVFVLLVGYAIVLAARRRQYLPVCLYAVLAAGVPLFYSARYGDVGHLLWEYFAPYVLFGVILERLPSKLRLPVGAVALVLSITGAVILSGVFTTGRWLT